MLQTLRKERKFLGQVYERFKYLKHILRLKNIKLLFKKTEILDFSHAFWFVFTLC